MVDTSFWTDKRVLITGNSGFKGSWLTMWLLSLGANVSGYSLKPPTEPNLFTVCKLATEIDWLEGDIRDLNTLSKHVREFKPDVIFHMAAQPLVRQSYSSPVETYEVNVMGTVNLLETVRCTDGVRSIVNVTTDKCYENQEWVWGYREVDRLGGYDPYSSSKACSELVTSSYRNSFFSPSDRDVGIATVRAGNVVGGGDWAGDRLVPDILKSLIHDEVVLLRNPQAVRPWQHVLEPLSGYLLLAEKLYENGQWFSEAWNFGPDAASIKPVKYVAERLAALWGTQLKYDITSTVLHEANLLSLDISKANLRLNWRPTWNLEETLENVVHWTKSYLNHEDMFDVSLAQIASFMPNVGN